MGMELKGRSGASSYDRGNPWAIHVPVMVNIGELDNRMMQASMETMRIRRSQGEAPAPGYLDGQMLVAMPGMMDERFARTVIYLCAHSPEGAMGIVVNKPAADLNFPDLLVQLDIIPEQARIRLPKRVDRMQVLMGGPVETGRGFVLHSPDFYLEQSTLPIDETVCLTATIDILRAIAKGEGPQDAVLALGYAGWSAGQLETEIQANGWLNCPADPELIFHSSLESKYALALRKLGVDPGMLSSQAGHA
jgi:putative transcriptional regulator